jgi:hypothetical protein
MNSDQNQTQFVDAIIARPPAERAPAFVKASLAIKRVELMNWLSKQPAEWINVQIKEAKRDPSKWYCEVDTWKPRSSGDRDDG